MEYFSALLAICAGNSPVTGASNVKSVDWKFDIVVKIYFKQGPMSLPSTERNREESMSSLCNNNDHDGIDNNDDDNENVEDNDNNNNSNDSANNYTDNERYRW